MAVENISIPLYDDPFYSYNIALEGNTYTLKYVYVERSSAYYISLYDAENNPLVVGEKLVPTYPLFADYIIEGLSGFFWMQQKSALASEPYKQYPESLSQYYDFFYSYYVEE